MDAQNMVAEIKKSCAELEKKKAEFLDKVKEIDEKLSYYNMAIQGLEQTIPINDAKRTWSRKPVILEYNGVAQSITAWAKQLGISHTAIQWRIKHGWPINRVLSPGRDKKPHNKKPRKVFAYDGHDNVVRQFVGINDASRSLNLPVPTLEKILANVSKEDQLRVRNYYLAYAT